MIDQLAAVLPLSQRSLKGRKSESGLHLLMEKVTKLYIAKGIDSKRPLIVTINEVNVTPL